MVRYLIIILLLSSCSSTHHLNKAIKKDPTILHNTVIKDTIQITKLDSIPYIVNDTIRYKLIERITDTIVQFEYKYITQPITRQEKRLKTKEAIKETKQEEKTKRTETRQVEKTERKGSNWIYLLTIGLIVGFGLGLLIKR